MGAWWKQTAEGYSSHVSKKVILEAVQQFAPSQVTRLSTLKKVELRAKPGVWQRERAGCRECLRDGNSYQAKAWYQRICRLLNDLPCFDKPRQSPGRFRAGRCSGNCSLKRTSIRIRWETGDRRDCRERRSQLRERPSVRASRLTLLLFGLHEAPPSLPTSGRSAAADHQARWASQSSA